MNEPSADLLLELGCEDLPARYVRPLANALAQGFAEGLDKRGVAHGSACSFATPRRIAVLLPAVAARQPDQRIERKGPKLAAALKDGQPTPAGLGFAKSCGVEFAALAQEDGQLVFRQTAPGRATPELIAGIFEETLKRMDELVPKRMRWGSGEETFVRPVQWIVALFGEAVVSLSRFGLRAGRLTYGHRFHAPESITLQTPAGYEAALRAAKVWADFDTRRADIRRQIDAEAVKLNGAPRVTEDLLDEVTALVEWPVVISGHIEARFLQLPPEVIVATVETNQRYFTLFGDEPSVEGQFKSESGYLKPVFITVSNIESKDVAQVIAGNERVVRPRLTDALFFWEQDRSKTLDEMAQGLSNLVFSRGLGASATVADKVTRIGELARNIAEHLSDDSHGLSGESWDEGDVASNAAGLCKADLVSRMVYEFPELQGIMGSYYALASGHSQRVAQAIREHYLPRFSGDVIPASKAGKALALADRVDTLMCMFAVGNKPTATKDPFALRRAASGIVRIIVEGRIDWDLKNLFTIALSNLPQSVHEPSPLELTEFVFERFRAYCLDDGASPEQFEAVRSLDLTGPLDFWQRLEALKAFSCTEAASSLAAAAKRSRNILKQASDASTGIRARPLEEAIERNLVNEVEGIEAQLRHYRPKRAYFEMLYSLATLRNPLDQFFDVVMVMVDDLEVRKSRLALLKRIDALCREVADLSCLPG